MTKLSYHAMLSNRHPEIYWAVEGLAILIYSIFLKYLNFRIYQTYCKFFQTKDYDIESQWNCQNCSYANSYFGSDISLKLEPKREPKKKKNEKIYA